MIELMIISTGLIGFSIFIAFMLELLSIKSYIIGTTGLILVSLLCLLFVV